MRAGGNTRSKKEMKSRITSKCSAGRRKVFWLRCLAGGFHCSSNGLFRQEEILTEMLTISDYLKF